MKALNLLFLRRETIVLLMFFLAFFSCSENDNSSDNNQGNGPSINLAEISGEYSGEASSSGGRTGISMRIRPRSTEGEYSIEFFGFDNLTSCCNSNGRPEALGSLILTGSSLNLDMNWNTDSPVCSGAYSGINGTFQNGNITIDVDFDLSCTGTGSETFRLSKTADL